MKNKNSFFFFFLCALAISQPCTQAMMIGEKVGMGKEKVEKQSHAAQETRRNREKEIYEVSERDNSSLEERTTEELSNNRSSETLEDDQNFFAMTPWQQALNKLEVEQAEWEAEWDKMHPDMMRYEKRDPLFNEAQKDQLLKVEEVLSALEDKDYLTQARQKIELAANLYAEARKKILEKEESQKMAMDGGKIKEAVWMSLLQLIRGVEHAQKAIEAEQNDESEIAARLREAQADANRASEYYLNEAAAYQSNDTTEWARCRRFAWTHHNRAEELKRNISYLEELKNVSSLFGADSPIANFCNKALQRQQAAVRYYKSAIQAHSEGSNLDWNKWIHAAYGAQHSAQLLNSSSFYSQQLIKANTTSRGAAFIVPLSKAAEKAATAAELYFKAEQAYLANQEEEAKLVEKSANKNELNATKYFHEAEKLKSISEVLDVESNSGTTTKETSRFTSAASSGAITQEKFPAKNIFEPSKTLSTLEEISLNERLEQAPLSSPYTKQHALGFSVSPETESYNDREKDVASHPVDFYPSLNKELSLEEQQKRAKQLRKEAEALTAHAKKTYSEALRASAEKMYQEASTHYAKAIHYAEQVVTAWIKTAKAHEPLPGRQWGVRLKDTWAQNVAEWKKEQAAFFEDLKRLQIETPEMKDFYSHQEKEIESLANKMNSLTLEKKNSSTSSPEPDPEIQARIIKGEPKSQCPYIREEGVIDPQTGKFIVRTRMAADHLLVRLKKGENPEEVKQIEEEFLKSLNYPGATLEEVSKKLSLYRLGFMMSKNSSDTERIKAMDAIQVAAQKNPLVIYCEPNFLMDLYATPNDTHYKDQWSIHQKECYGINPPLNLFAPLFNKPAAPITVAVIDSGIKYNHEDFKGQMWTDSRSGMRGINSFNATVRANSPAKVFAQDKNGHGTHCAGIIGATAGNQKGIAGIAGTPGIVKLMACKYYKTDSNVDGSIKNIIKSIEYACDNDARILNCSWGYKPRNPNDPQPIKDAFKKASEQGTISVVAAGNDGENNDNVTFYPANFATGNDPVKNMIVVAATDQEGKLASWDLKDEQGNVTGRKSSNYGQETVHLTAPGKDILSTGHSSSKAYIRMTGTSMAAPHVVGALALMMAKKPFVPSREDLSDKEKNNELQRYNEDLIGTLCETAKKDPQPLNDQSKIQDRVKYGRLNLNAALKSDSEKD